MKPLLLLLLISFILGVSSQNIAVNSTYGPAWIDPEDLLETTLSQALFADGILKLEVDGILGSNNAVFAVQLYSLGNADKNFKDILQKVLVNKFKFNGVTVKNEGMPSNYYSRFLIYLNPSNATKELQVFAEKTMKTMYLELEDSPFD